MLVLNVGPEEENLRDSTASLDFSIVAKQVVNTPFEGISVTTPKRSRMPLVEAKTPTSPFAGRVREMMDSVERIKKQIPVIKEENRQKAKEQRKLLKEMQAAEKENNAKFAKASQEVFSFMTSIMTNIFVSESVF